MKSPATLTDPALRAHFDESFDGAGGFGLAGLFPGADFEAPQQAVDARPADPGKLDADFLPAIRVSCPQRKHVFQALAACLGRIFLVYSSMLVSLMFMAGAMVSSFVRQRDPSRLIREIFSVSASMKATRSPTAPAGQGKNPD
jgi:hypothetical protein